MKFLNLKSIYLMKKLFLFSSSVIMLAFIFESCKKDKDTSPATTLQKIQAKWSVESIIVHEYDPPSDLTDTTQGVAVATDYVDFRTDGKVYSFLAGELDTSSYTLSGDTTIIVDLFANFKIQSLTDHVLKLYTKGSDDPTLPAYWEFYYNLKK
jgi:hypothetical protein